MSTSLFYRRRAERFAGLIEQEAEGRTDTPAGTDLELGTLVSLTRRVADLPMSVESHPEFRDGLRAVLMATIEREGIGATAEPQRASDSMSRREARAAAAERRRARRRTRAFGAVVAGLAATALGLSGVSLASGTALPGQALYTVKRQTERAQIALTGSDTSKGQLYLDFARTRLDEAKAVTDEPATFASILDDMDKETQEGVKLLIETAIDRRDPAALDIIDAFVDDQRPGIARLMGSLTGKNRQRANESSDLIERVATRSAAIRPMLPCGSDAIAARDALGPSPKPQCTGQYRPQDQTTSSADGGKPTIRQTPQSRDKSGTPKQTITKNGNSAVTDPAESATPLDNATLTGGPSDVIGDVPN